MKDTSIGTVLKRYTFANVMLYSVYICFCIIHSCHIYIYMFLYTWSVYWHKRINYIVAVCCYVIFNISSCNFAFAGRHGNVRISKLNRSNMRHVKDTDLLEVRLKQVLYSEVYIIYVFDVLYSRVLFIFVLFCFILFTVHISYIFIVFITNNWIVEFHIWKHKKV